MNLIPEELGSAINASTRRGVARLGGGGSHGLKRRAPLVLAIVAGIAFAELASSYDVFLGCTVLVFGIAAVGQDWLVGRAGQISVGGAAIMGIGAYTTALTVGIPILGNFPLPLIISAIVGALVGVVIGLPSLRLKEFYLLVATLALQEIFEFVGNQIEVTHPSGFDVAGINVGSADLSGATSTFLIMGVVLVALGIFLANLYRVAPGRIWASVKESEQATATMGISTVRWKLGAFVGSSAITAMAGGFFAYVIGTVSYESFSLTVALSLLLMVFLGGRGSIPGALVGACLVELLPVGLQDVTQALPSGSVWANWLSANSAFLNTAIYGAALLVILLYMPDGLAQVGRFARDRTLAVLARGGRGTSAASTVGQAEQIQLAGEATALHVQTRPVAEDGARASNGHVSLEKESTRPVLLGIRDLRVQYPTGAVGLAGVSLEIAPGEVVAIVGRNGAGKTTALRAIAGFSRRERVHISGAVDFEGRSVVGASPTEMARRGIGLVPERTKVFPSLTVLEHLRAAGVGRPETKALLERLPSLAGKEGLQAGLLSGGQRQALAIAVAMARRPRLLLVDELTLGLAPITAKTLSTELAALREEFASALLLVDQSLEIVARIADRVYVFDHGEVVAVEGADYLTTADARRAILGSL